MGKKAKRKARERLKLANKQAERLSRRQVSIMARFDAAQTITDNTNHWVNADYLSADGAATATIRRTLRSRARYEVANNSYARGILQTLAEDTIGRGPRLRMLTADSAPIEAAFSEWAEEIGLAAKLRTMRVAEAQDGESFAVLKTNRRLTGPVQLDLQLIEADRVTDPDAVFNLAGHVDGIRYDADGNPTSYRILSEHPGDTQINPAGSYKDWPAERVIHYFRADRPGQHRGLPEILPALPLFAELRRYMRAVVAAAEAVADVALTIQSNNPASNEDDSGWEAMDTIELEKRMATMLPEGYQLGQVRAEQPPTTFDMFVATLLKEIGRCLSMPFNVIAGDSSQYNYASGRLDHQVYFKAIQVARHERTRVVLRPILLEWLREYLAASSGISPRSINLSLYPYTWAWDGHEHVDPLKEAEAAIRLRKAGLLTKAAYHSKQGADWEVEEEQFARELGISVDELRELERQQVFGESAGPDTEAEEEESNAQKQEA